MKYLFIGAHTDDVELCCGATICKLLDHEDTHIKVVTLSNSQQDEWVKSMEYLGVHEYSLHNYPIRNFNKFRQSILDYLVELDDDYDMIFTHDPSDNHQDHKVVGEESIRAFRGRNLATYVGMWNGNLDTNYYIQVDQVHLSRKIEALSIYNSQSGKTYMSDEFNVHAASINAIHAFGHKRLNRYVEAFALKNYVG